MPTFNEIYQTEKSKGRKSFAKFMAQITPYINLNTFYIKKRKRKFSYLEMEKISQITGFEINELFPEE